MPELASQTFETLAQPLPEAVQRTNYDGIEAMQEQNRVAWSQLFARLVPRTFQSQVAECAG
jgi:hypothetical protein